MRGAFKALGWGAVALALLIAVAVAYFWVPSLDRATLKSRYGQPPSRFVPLDSGTVIHYRDHGPKTAPAVILLHGTGASLHTWEPWAERLTTDARLIAMDLPAHGLTGATAEGDYSRAGMVAAVHALVEALGLESFVIGGNSMGGAVALLYQRTYPGRVDGLVLVDTSGFKPEGAEGGDYPLAFRVARMPVIKQVASKITPRSMIEAGLEDAVAAESVVTQARVDRYWELLRLEGSREAMIELFATPRSNDIPVAEIEAPALILWGRHDRLIPLSVGRALAERMPDACLHVYDAGHIPMVERPDETAADVRAFLTRLYGDAGGSALDGGGNP